MAVYRLHPAAPQPIEAAVDAVLRAVQRAGGVRAELEVRKVPIVEEPRRPVAQARIAIARAAGEALKPRNT